MGCTIGGISDLYKAIYKYLIMDALELNACSLYACIGSQQPVLQ